MQLMPSEAIGIGDVSPLLPLLILGDMIDVCKFEDLTLIVTFVERYFIEFTKEPIFSNGKFHFIRLANSILKSLPKSRYPLECGKMQILLSKFVPIYEKSGLNLNGEYSIDVVGLDAEPVDYDLPPDLKSLSDFDPKNVQLSKNFFEIFWQLQTYVKNPTLLLNAISDIKNDTIWNKFTEIVDELINIFNRQYMECICEPNNQSDIPYTKLLSTINPCSKYMSWYGDKDFPPFYVTINRYYPNYKLLERQMSDPKFQLNVMSQILILLSTVEGGIKNISKNDLPQISWIESAFERIFKILKQLSEKIGCHLDTLLKFILEKEKLFVEWKDKNCPPATKNKPSESKSMYKPINFSRFDTSKSMNLGHPLITRLWNICPNNMESCKMPSRNCVPTIDNFFEEAISQLNPTELIEDEYKLLNNPSFQWRALRLLSRNTSKYFSTSYQQNMTPSQYLINVLGSIYNKDFNDPKTFLDNASSNGEIVMQSNSPSSDQHIPDSDCVNNN